MLIAIKQWAFTLVITAVVGGLANSLTVSDNGGIKKYIKFACSIVALAVMIMPIKELFREMPGFLNFNADAYEQSETYDYTEQLNELTIAKTEELLKKRIYDIVYEKTGIKPGGVDIYIKYNNYSEIYVEKIIIEMPEKPEEIKLYLKQLLNCEVEVREKNNE